MKRILIVLMGFFVIACNNENNTSDPLMNEQNAGTGNLEAPVALAYTIEKVYTHDTSSYTQGLEWYNNKLYESTGLKGKSRLYQMDTNLVANGNELVLPANYFGEGITIFKDKIYQLTWEEHKVFVYDAKTLKKVKELAWPYEGWGLTHNDSAIIVSTGSSNLYFVNPDDFSIQKTIGVYHQYGYQNMLNELEYVNGKIWANIYGQNEIVVIDPLSGQIINKIDFTNLLAQAKVKYNPLSVDAGYVLNGIAYKAATNTYFITGKCWPVVVEVKIN
jgi:glutamine cyclotransferase